MWCENRYCKIADQEIIQKTGYAFRNKKKIKKTNLVKLMEVDISSLPS